MTQCNGQQAIFWSASTSDLVLRGLLGPDDDRLCHDLPHPAPSPSSSSGAGGGYTSKWFEQNLMQTGAMDAGPIAP